MKRYAAIILLLPAFIACNKDTVVDVTPISAKGDILFISRRIPNSADWQMFLMNADGTNQRLISNSLVRCAPPVLSNNKNKIAFTTYENFYYNLYIIDSNGQNQKLLTTGKQFCGSPAWSPDDNTIVFVKNDNAAGGNYDIYSINISSGVETKLTVQNDNFSPRYFSNGESIIYTSSNSVWSGIYKMNIDGSSNQLLSRPATKSFGNPVPSPDGNKIAVTSYDHNGSQIFVMNANGSNLKQITFTASSYHFPGEPREGNCNPVWSPNSNKIAYVSYENGSPDIFLINADGTGNRRLTDTPLRDENPCWTRDGNILFSSNRNHSVSSEIYIMRTGGQLQTPLTNYVGDDIYPTFIER